MAREKKAYRKLAGSGSSLISVHALWLGQDHLLSVKSYGYTEYYRRFPYKDIQAVTAIKTSRGKITSLILSVPAALLLFAAYKAGDELSFVLLFLAGICLSFLLVNVLLGPTCSLRVHTAVQTADMPSPCRMRKAMKVMDRLRFVLESTQGYMAPEAFLKTDTVLLAPHE